MKRIQAQLPKSCFLHDSIQAVGLLSSKFMRRTPGLNAFLCTTFQWYWTRVGDKTIVVICNEQWEDIGLGWTVRGRKDVMNERIAVTTALSRAVRHALANGRCEDLRPSCPACDLSMLPVGRHVVCPNCGQRFGKVERRDA